MKYNIRMKFVISFSILIFIISCHDSPIETSSNYNINDDTTKIESMPKHFLDEFGEFYSNFTNGHMLAIVQHIRDWPNRVPYFQVLCGIKRGYGGDMILSDANIPRRGDGYVSGWTDDYNPVDPQQPKFGATTKWELSGNDSINFIGFSTTMYVPKVIEILSPKVGFYNYTSVSDSLKIEWNADHDNNNGVWVYVYYEGDYLDFSDDFYWYQNVVDNGVFLIRLDKMLLPKSGVLEISLSRFNEKIIIVENDTIAIRAESQVKSFVELKE